ncbi:MAG: VWA domain-containing protein, partial [Halomonas sp.]|nr:VWA domain-containing protein [Halomonas sp.]
TIEGGSNSVTLTAVDDVFAEELETLTATISGVTDTDASFEAVAAGNTDNGYSSDADSATTTILDNDIGVDASDVLVDEDNLPTGNNDSAAGDDDQVLTGTISYVLPAENTLASSGAIALSVDVSTLTTSDGQSVSSIWDAGSNTLIAYTGTDSSDTDNHVFTVTLDAIDATNNTASYTAELLQAVQHTSSGTEDNIDLSVSVAVTDSAGNEGSGSFTLTIDDDMPTITDGECVVDVETGGPETSTLGADLVLMIDTSGSVSSSDLDSIRDSLETLFNSGAVNSVFLTSFASSATFHDSGENDGWYTDLDAALTVIDSFSSGGFTDYDAAIDSVTSNFAPPPSVGGKLISMFVSDGEPNETNGSGSVGITEGNGEESAWINFLQDNAFDESFSVGYGGLDSSGTGFLEPIAWTSGEAAGTYTGSDDGNVIILDDVEDLAATLQSTVTTTPDSVSGSVIDTINYGADEISEPELTSVTYGSTTVVFDAGTTSATFETNAGKITINQDGSYEFTALDQVTGDVEDSISYTVTDSDGDKATADLCLKTTDSVPTAEVDNVTVVEGENQASLNLQLILDDSGSMYGENLTAMKQAIADLFDTGSINSVRVITFSGHASSLNSGGWYNNTADAYAAINSALKADGGTDYDDALEEAQRNFTQPTGGISLVSVFMTDGQPNSSDKVNPGEEDDWLKFLQDNGFDASYVVGFGEGFGDDTSEIQPIAAKPDADGNYSSESDDSDVILTVDNADLSAQLQSLLGLTVGASGNVTDNDDEGIDGWGSPTLVSVEFDGTTYTFSASQTEVTITTAAGDLLIRDDGSYEFTQAEGITADQTATVNYTVQDADGSTSTSALELTTLDTKTFTGVVGQTLKNNTEMSFELGGLASSVKVEISGYSKWDEDGEIVLKKDGAVIETYDLDNAFDGYYGNNQFINTFGSGDLFDEVVIRNTDGWYWFDVDRVEASVDPDTSPIQNGTLVDGIVEGALYTTSSGLTGTTDAQGAFSYREGDTVTFMVGDVVIGSAKAEDLAAGKVFLQDLADVALNDLNDEYVENMAVFLQSLDADGNAYNGITITPAMHTAFENSTLDLRSVSEAELKAHLEGVGAVYVNEEEAMQHVRDMLEKHAGVTEFEEHSDDSIQTAVLVHEALEGLTYQTSSGLVGELNQGEFLFDEGDTVELFANGHLVASFATDDIGEDGLITFAEAGFTISDKELDALINGEEEQALEDAESTENIPVDDDVTSDDVTRDESSGEITEEDVATPDEKLSQDEVLAEDDEVTNVAPATAEAETEESQGSDNGYSLIEDDEPLFTLNDDSENATTSVPVSELHTSESEGDAEASLSESELFSSDEDESVDSLLPPSESGEEKAKPAPDASQESTVSTEAEPAGGHTDYVKLHNDHAANNSDI